MSNSTHFVFQHPVFGVEGGYFSAGEDGAACFHIPMSEGMAAVPLPALRKEFGIAEGSEDGRLLAVVDRALAYVISIRVNDAIPNELIDGTASWSVGEHHGTLARMALERQVLAWVRGPEERRAGAEIEMDEAVAQLAGRLELDRPGLESRIAGLAHELAYLEALRERYGTIREIETLLKHAARLCGQGPMAQEEVGRVRTLLGCAFIRIDSQFELMDKQIESVDEVLADVEGQVELVRAVRDEIHGELMIWDDLTEAWQALAAEMEQARATELVKETYRFLARNYPINNVW